MTPLDQLIKRQGAATNPSGAISQIQAAAGVPYSAYQTLSGNVPASPFPSSTSRQTSPSTQQQIISAPTGPTPEELAMEKARRNTLASISNVQSGADQNIGDVRSKYRTDTLGFLGGLEDTQNQLNEGGIQNQLNLRRTMSAVIDGVRQGLRSGAVNLAGMNASESGAAEALARAYSRVGNKQAQGAEGDASLVDQDMMRQQGVLNRRRDENVDTLELYKDNEVNRIKRDVAGQLRALDAAATNEGLPGIVDMGMVSDIVAKAVSQLKEIDSIRSKRLSGIHSLDPQERLRQAVERDQAGAAATPFSVEGPNVGITNGMGGGTPVSQLPIYVKRNDEKLI